jgi:hypothetical protein
MNLKDPNCRECKRMHAAVVEPLGSAAPIKNLRQIVVPKCTGSKMRGEGGYEAVGDAVM